MMDAIFESSKKIGINLFWSSSEENVTIEAVGVFPMDDYRVPEIENGCPGFHGGPVPTVEPEHIGFCL